METKGKRKFFYVYEKLKALYLFEKGMGKYCIDFFVGTRNDIGFQFFKNEEVEKYILEWESKYR